MNRIAAALTNTTATSRGAHRCGSRSGSYLERSRRRSGISRAMSAPRRGTVPPKNPTPACTPARSSTAARRIPTSRPRPATRRRGSPPAPGIPGIPTACSDTGTACARPASRSRDSRDNPDQERARRDLGRSSARTAVIVIAVSALHHSRGFPPPQIVATLPWGGKFCQYAIGRSISGQVHHCEEYGWVAALTLPSYHITSL